MIKVFEMFAGCGGTSWALNKAGVNFDCVGFSEIDAAAKKCLSRNFPDIKNYGDCRDICPEDLPKFNLLTGGFPCQSFSEAGKHGGELDTRGTLFHDIIRIANEKKPKYMMLENVKGLTFKNHEKTFNKILSELDRIGYSVYWKVLNSRDHGIPQNRERIFFVCFRKDIDSGFKFPNKVPLEIFLKDIVEPSSEEELVSIAIRNVNRSKHQAKGLPYGTFPKKYRLKYNKDIGVSYAIKSATHEFMVGTKDDVVAANSKLEKIDDELTPKECFKHLTSNNGDIRELTPKECFRLMGFLDDEINLEGLSKSQKYKIAGNGWDINIVSKLLSCMLGKDSEKGDHGWVDKDWVDKD